MKHEIPKTCKIQKNITTRHYLILEWNQNSSQNDQYKIQEN